MISQVYDVEQLSFVTSSSRQRVSEIMKSHRLRYLLYLPTWIIRSFVVSPLAFRPLSTGDFARPLPLLLPEHDRDFRALVVLGIFAAEIKIKDYNLHPTDGRYAALLTNS